MREAAKGYLALAGSLTEVTRQRATAAARALVSQGEATAEQVGTLVEDLLAQSRQNREAVAALVTYEVDRTLGRIGLASEGEVAALVDRVRALEAQVQRLAAGSGGAAPQAESGRATATSPAEDAPVPAPGITNAADTWSAATSGATTSTTTAPAKQAAAGRAPAEKKASAAKAPAKKASAAKAPAKKASAARAPAKKSAAAKAPAKPAEAPARKTAAAKAPEKKASAANAPATKSVADKAPTTESSTAKASAKAPAKTTAAETAAAATAAKAQQGSADVPARTS
jgi:polyhydroxyalkanoate synthesis regulator phasin